MKKIYITILTIFLLLCCHSKKEGDYNIIGSINQDSGKVYLFNYDETKIIDSTNIENGRFYFEGFIQDPDLYYLNVKGSPYLNAFFIERTDISINITDTLGFYKFEIKGGGLDLLFREYLKIYSKRNLKIHNLREAIKTSTNEENKNKLHLKLDSMNQKIQDEIDIFLRHHSNSEISPYILLLNRRDISILKKYYSEMPENIKKTIGGVRLLEKIKKIESQIKVGDTFPFIELPNLNGSNSAILSSFDNGKKIVLVDFWASWCKPCIEQFPALKKIHQDYKEYGFDIMGISIDMNSHRWKEAVKKEELEWEQFIDSTRVLPKKLKFSAIPINYLINKEGEIIAKNLDILSMRISLDSILLK